MIYYTTIEIEEIYGTVCYAYPDIYGIETEDSLNKYEDKSQGIVQVMFVPSIKDI
tara:strand:- start:34 stop:198 length:165 start_codon:yes stop_codon:yes gene_type:complete